MSAPTQNGTGIAAATASPALSYQIGQYFKGKAQQNPDGRLTAQQETAHILAHAVLGAATAAAGENNALTGAIGAGGAEAAAPYVSKWLYGEKDGSKLTAEQKETVSSILSLGGATVGTLGGLVADTVAGSQAAKGAVENNYFLTSAALSRDPKEARNTYRVLKEKVDRECSSGRIHECRQDIERIIGFAKDPGMAGKYKDLQNESIRFLSRHPGLVADYLTAQYEKLDKEDKSILHRYITPGAEIVSGAAGIVISAKAGMATCAQSFGLTCGAASFGAVSSGDHLVTGWNNFGKKASEQKPTITVQGLKELGLSEQAAEYVQFSLDLFSVGKAGMGVPKAKPVPDVKPGWQADGSTNAGSIRNVNPGYPKPGRTHNCANCAVATDATLNGRPASALPINHTNGVSPRVLENMYGRKFDKAVSNISILENQMQSAGHGATGIVFGYTPGERLGHVFNVVNQNGTIRFLDGQTGKPAVLNFKQYQLLRTN